MNTANLQLEGLYVAMSAIMNAVRQKGILTEEEIDRSLEEAEAALAGDANRPQELSAAYVDAILFPVRYLRLANRTWADGEFPLFAELGARVGREKPQAGDVMAEEREDIEASEDEDVRRLEREAGQGG